jgi:parvulin-like peptidyl-prolyl isomerase
MTALRSALGTAILLAALAACAGAPRPSAPAGYAPEAVAARVNGVVITEAALGETVERMRSSRHIQPAADGQDARRRALDQMVLQELAVQEAARQGVHVEEKDVNAAMKTLTTSLGHAEGFEAFLKERHLTAEEVRSQIERRLLLERMVEKEVRAKVSLAPDAARQEYEQNRKAYVVPEQAVVMDYAFNQKQGSQAMLKKAEELLAAVKAGRDLRTVPSDDIFTVQERALDARREPLLFGPARGLAEGAFSGLIETPAGSHVLQLVRVTPERQLTFEEAQEAIERKLRFIAETRRLAEWQDELRKNAVIEYPGSSAPAGGKAPGPR